ncbi:MAG: hypothetical protein ACYTXY_45055 [Nostoc sp.]
MTFAISKELKFLTGHGFYVNLTPMAFRATPQELSLDSAMAIDELPLHENPNSQLKTIQFPNAQPSRELGVKE